MTGARHRVHVTAVLGAPTVRGGFARRQSLAACPTSGHATRRLPTMGVSPSLMPRGGDLQIGDIVRRSDARTDNRYVIVNIKAPWIYTHRISGSGGPGIITFPTRLMLEKVT
jgi:hypothetical protein